ncbi:chitin synthase-domain-containing protein [Mycena sanguinolenta]|nr:chitin synthase-domain-containing protein [Mycena sanguinolenta]
MTYVQGQRALGPAPGTNAPNDVDKDFMSDAIVNIFKSGLSLLVRSMIHDKKLLGVCGKTQLANAKQSIITMAQVYEYFISHNMAKAFESLFGSVTCLPGCFTLYRLRTPDTHKSLLISNQLIQDYSEKRIDTFHMKNLLHLSEDRYLTTRRSSIVAGSAPRYTISASSCSSSSSVVSAPVTVTYIRYLRGSGGRDGGGCEYGIAEMEMAPRLPSPHVASKTERLVLVMDPARTPSRLRA